MTLYSAMTTLIAVSLGVTPETFDQLGIQIFTPNGYVRDVRSIKEDLAAALIDVLIYDK